jgi:hypothetical protein
MRNCYSYVGAFRNYDPQAFLYNGRSGIVGIDYGSVEHCYYNWLDPEVYGEEVNNPAIFSHEDLDATMFRWVDDEWTLLEPVTVGGMETDDFNEALNAWTNTQANVSEYLQWHANYAVLPNGLPILYEENNQLFPRGTEWYYEIKHLTGEITYQHLEYTADTAINSKRVKIITETNTMYDKEQWTDFEYIYEDGDRIYWWNKDLQDFTLLYDFVDILVLNVSQGTSVSKVIDHLLELRRYNDANKPIVFKLSHDLSSAELDEIAAYMLGSGIDGVMVGAEFIARIQEKTLGLLPIIATGEISTPARAAELLDAGASLVALTNSPVHYGPRYISKIVKYLEKR